MKKAALAGLLASIFLTGCATIDPDQTEVTFDSNPPGATIYIGETAIGVGPVSRRWNMNGKQTGVLPTMSARWVSGARVDINITVTRGKGNSYTFQRPSGAPNLDADIQWAIHLQRKDAAGRADLGDAYSDFGKSIGGAMVRPGAAPPAPSRSSADNSSLIRPRSTTNCTTRRVGSTAYTTCD